MGISHFAIPCWYVTWAQIEKFLFGISSRRRKVAGAKDEMNSGFAIPLDAPNDYNDNEPWQEYTTMHYTDYNENLIVIHCEQCLQRPQYCSVL